MNKFLFLLLAIFLTVNLNAYSKKIILASFTSQERAQKMKDSLADRTPTLYKMTKKYDFAFVIRKSGKYHMLSAEVFTRSKALDIVFKEAKKRFKGAYYNDQTSSLNNKTKKVIEVEAVKFETVAKEKIIIQRKIKPDENTTLVKKENPVIEDKNTTVVKVETLEPIKLQAKPKAPKVESSVKEESTFWDYFHWSYLVMLIIAGVLTYYFIKFKKIYDEY